MTLIAIDPGTDCGWAVRLDTGEILSGEWTLRGSRYDGGGMRFVILRRFLEQLFETTKPTMLAYEEVRRHLGVDAAHVYGGIIAVVQAVCEERKIPYLGIPVATVKKFATGSGNAKKEAMISAANTKWKKNYAAKDNNEVDARWIAECAARDYP